MTKPINKLTRRDAIKILGAAVGASLLANLPSKWSTPELTSGILPAHAATSAVFSLVCDADFVAPSCASNVTSGVTINPPVAGILMQYNVSTSAGSVTQPSPASGTALTDGSGHASVICDANVINITFTIDWSFANPLQGSGSCTQVIGNPCS